MFTPKIDPAQPRVRTTLWVIGSVAGAGILIGASVLVTEIYEVVDSVRTTQVNNTDRAERDRVRDRQTAEAAEAAARAVQRIEDCTTPGMQCFEDAQKRTGEAVAGINRGTAAVIVAALSCQADGITEQRALARCTVRRAQESTVDATQQPQENR